MPFNAELLEARERIRARVRQEAAEEKEKKALEEREKQAESAAAARRRRKAEAFKSSVKSALGDYNKQIEALRRNAQFLSAKALKKTDTYLELSRGQKRAWNIRRAFWNMKRLRLRLRALRLWVANNLNLFKAVRDPKWSSISYAKARQSVGVWTAKEITERIETAETNARRAQNLLDALSQEENFESISSEMSAFLRRKNDRSMFEKFLERFD